MQLPIAAIVGRPNVGKSCLFNRIVRERIAVVDDLSGVTRDRNYRQTTWEDCPFLVVDTGGLVPISSDTMTNEIRKQVDYAIAEASAIVFVVDLKTGPTDLDLIIAAQLRKNVLDKVILVVNKAESAKAIYDLGSFMALGLGEPIPVSALHGTGTTILLDRICEIFKAHSPGVTDTQPEPDALRIAILGRPNAGKSSLVNRLLGNERMIVDATPGTTRDAIDSPFVYGDTRMILIDTAGLRRKSQVKNDVEYYSNLRTLASIERCHLCVLVIDTPLGCSEQDMKIMRQVIDAHKGVVICFNKWDIVDKDHRTFDGLCRDTREKYTQLKHVPMLSISALSGQRVKTVIETSIKVHGRMNSRIPQSGFNANIRSWSTSHPHPLIGGKQVRLFGGKQVAAEYPLFHIFANQPGRVQPEYARFLTNNIYAGYELDGCPVVLHFRLPAREKSSGGGKGAGTTKETAMKELSS